MSKDDEKVVSLTQRRMEEFWGKPISIYTRAQALADGVLVDLTDTARNYGFKIPFSCTEAVWQSLDWPAGHKPGGGQSTAGRVHDVLVIARLAANGAARAGASVADFDVLMVPTRGQSVEPEAVRLRLMVSAGDNGEPVLTLMYPGED
ncbi:TPA: hypothetical protein UOJ11_001311 [Stenotrophomonas maltophilia]|uniref:DUF6573 family protein n=1 Tax=Stenotrophomonas maltophilia TaxID=40324 RepID=UPI0021BE0079|nr:DUF6573 family protein [Stenotrophomonas maltophilia]UXL28794.1 hypothetical protein N0O74_20570 [Stenotrophomonas maltophilia]HEL5321650.1 hypothetical protein [Stenotrophomonas maltophilia]